ncbi:MAG: ABC transporter permease [Desulfuromonas sp.]|uniref:ABC transporter permease n=1 Tax=Desulfuromonas sp. TaxID=892 RepID=UPI000CB9A322|nr:MAG: ABC transporter permease [Desulfuromonas sp.]
MPLSLKIALSSLRTHRLRTALAMIGVLLGALALTGVQHVSEAMHRKAEIETAKLGTNLFVARTGQVSFRRSGSARVRNEARTFSLGDAKALAAGLPSVRRGAPFVERTMPIRAGDVKIPSRIVATWPDYPAIRNFRPELGRFLSAEDEASRARVCVLGRKIAERLFGRPEAAIGRQVFFFRASARVIGVMEAKGADISGTDQDEQVFVPLSTYIRRFANQDWITGVYLQLERPGDYAGAKEGARQILRRRHGLGPGQADDFSLLTAQDTMQLQQQALDLVQTLGLISSSVSFAVGGLGILSIMVLLVRVRRLEIGIRRAVGARRRDIVRQFMFEAGLMAGIGGAAGVILAMGLLLLVYRLGDMPLVYDPLLILGPLAGSVLLGLAAGAYPAWQAAHVEVLEVLKTE